VALKMYVTRFELATF